MISRFISGVFLLGAIGLLIHIPGVSVEAHRLVHDFLALAQTMLTAVQHMLSKANA